MTGLDLGFCQNGDSDSLPGSYAPGIPGAALLALPTAHFHGEPVTRAGNPGFARGSKPVAELFTAARAVEWLIRLPVWENWLASKGMRQVDARPGIAFSTMDQAINAAVSGAGVAVVDAPMVERDLRENRLRRLDEHELIGPQGYWFVEPRERGVQDAAHSAVVALFQAWLLAVSRAQ